MPARSLRRVAGAFTLAGVATAFGAPVAVAGSATAGAAPAAIAPVTTLTCDDGATHALATGHLLNNQWNKRLAGAGPWRQCLHSRVSQGRTEYGWSWQWPQRDGLYAYPGLLIGRSPWLGTPNNDTRFPLSLEKTKTLQIEYDIESSYQGKRNLAVEFWITDSASKQAGPSAIQAELMIWTDASPGMVSARDKPEATVEISGSMWRLYVHRNWGDISGGSTRQWTLVSYHAVVPTLSARYDARRFFQDAIDRGLIDVRHHIADVELGNEIVSGSGSTWIRKFEVTVE